ncbi:MAG: GtrA family protein [Albidovulum sp.]
MMLALRSRPDLWRFVKFLFVGVLNTAFGFVVYALLLRVAGLPWQWALALSYVLGILWNFATHGRIVFGTRGLGRLPAYVGSYVVLFFLNRWALAAAIAAGLSELWAQALLVLPMAMVAFVLVSVVLTGRPPFLKAQK